MRVTIPASPFRIDRNLYTPQISQDRVSVRVNLTYLLSRPRASSRSQLSSAELPHLARFYLAFGFTRVPGSGAEGGMTIPDHHTTQQFN
jgi:hypothetical protein